MNSAYATAQRSPRPDILTDSRAMESLPEIVILDTIPSPVLLLNCFRQLVHGNKAFWDYLGQPEHEAVLGGRPGEIFDCTYSHNDSGGCGTTEFCRECGAVRAILSSIGGLRDTRECNLLREVEGEVTALDLLVHAVPHDVLGRRFTILTLHDVSHEKRRRYLERIFFHDIVNSAGNALSLVDLLHEEEPDPVRKEDLGLLVASLTQVMDEIDSQRTLLAAESQDLSVHPTPLRSDKFLHLLADKYTRHHEAREKDVVVDCASQDTDLTCDPSLLGRVLGNMIKNALEASAPGQTVRLSCSTAGGGVRFAVRNPAVIPPQAQRQIFKRSFSSKGPDRGLGTFSMRLLAQNYLGGRVWFHSSEDEGTVFTVELPRSPAGLS